MNLGMYSKFILLYYEIDILFCIIHYYSYKLSSCV